MSILKQPETWRRLQVAALVAFAVSLPLGQAPTWLPIMWFLVALIIATAREPRRA